MSTQNLISASIPDELKTAINEKITGLERDLGFVISLLPGDKRDYISVGNVMLPFLDLAYNTFKAHPEIMPGLFEKAEYEKDYKLTKDLALIGAKLAELNAAVQTTLHAVTSDAMVESLEVYASVLRNEDRVPGFDVTATDMRQFFKKKGKSKSPAEEK